ncbi:DUF932 domain-containing protein [Roseibium sediminicola]|uniref:DUF945 domain-containing protein n=1 Tax=Roseibium sediminicola TaxID=2933272 RepID=A0ABT0H007_9HYPH|nr:DUF932 domain-containing protein [Roseibium sp. CAU 1639]MCK7615014.1 DUF945 domain-containing protein [Roseibium sp. CAU 1639]
MTVYAHTARFDHGRALSEDELRRLAPSIFATSAHESRSDRFQPIPTIDILRGLMEEGFMPVGAKQARTRDETKSDFTKHLIRLRRLDDDRKYSVGDTVCEILLKNANDGTSAYDLMAGLFRVCCLNSLVSQTSTLDSVKVRHSGDVGQKVIEGTYRVMKEAEKALIAPADWSMLNLNTDERHAFAEAAHVLRFGDAEGETNTPVKPQQLLDPRRRGDTGKDLWTTFNVTQENMIRGGIRAVSREANGRRRQSRTRAVNGIDQDIKLNKALWVLTEKMAELKGFSAAA